MSYNADSLAIAKNAVRIAEQQAYDAAQIVSDANVVKAYLIYLPIAILLTALVSHKLFKSGKVFMLDIFNQKEDIAYSTNKLFELGFYLINLGFAFKILYIDRVEGSKELIEALANKVGFFAIYLGVMLFANLFMFFRGKKVASQKRRDRALYESAPNPSVS